MRDTVFVSYSHADRAALSELEAVLDRVEPRVNITLWNDARISPAARWRDEVDEALATAAAAVLLVSRAFLDSAFIREFELPPIMSAAARGELKVFAVVLDRCGHDVVTATFQAVHDPSQPLAALAPEERAHVWQRLAAALAVVAAGIDDEARIGAELERVSRDLAAEAEVARVLDKITRARIDPAFTGYESMRENTLVFLEGELCQVQSTWLIEQSKRNDLTRERSQAIVRMLQDVSRRNEAALGRATELTRQFANETRAMLDSAKGGGPAA